jgi:hypothetical protein
VFDATVARWECIYAMMSIALDDALALRSSGRLICARQQVSVVSDLLSRLSEILVSFCTTLSNRGRHIGNLPAVEPLNSEFFRGDTAQSAASWNAILHQVLFGERSRFFHKVRILSGTLEQLESEFTELAGDVYASVPPDHADSWRTLECLHYDFNTCLREAEVVLKSFLFALPASQLSAFAAELENPPATKRVRSRPRAFRVSA